MSTPSHRYKTGVTKGYPSGVTDPNRAMSASVRNAFSSSAESAVIIPHLFERLAPRVRRCHKTIYRQSVRESALAKHALFERVVGATAQLRRYIVQVASSSS